LGIGDGPPGRGTCDRRRRPEGALFFDSGPPLVCDEPAATYERASDEHGRLALSAAANRLALGDKLCLIPGHCDPTVILYDWYVFRDIRLRDRRDIRRKQVQRPGRGSRNRRNAG
jgi:D-serine deaminase-like pyridoxal phosphate-dependent protein